MEKDRVLELAALAKDYWQACGMPSGAATADDFVAAAQRALSREAEEGGYAKAFEEVIGWIRTNRQSAGTDVAVDWKEARRIAEALEDERDEHHGPWRKLHVEGTLCYAHQTVSEGNLALFAEYWGQMGDMPEWDRLSSEQKLTALLRSARSHFAADLDLTADDFTVRMDPSLSDGASRLLDPVAPTRENTAAYRRGEHAS